MSDYDTYSSAFINSPLHSLARSRLQFHWRGASYKRFRENYDSDGWLHRKIWVLPALVWNIVVKVPYHFAKVILIGIPRVVVFGNEKYLFRKVYYLARDGQEIFGRILLIVWDPLGMYHIEESNYHKACYNKYGTHPVKSRRQPPVKPNRSSPKVEQTRNQTNQVKYLSETDILKCHKQATDIRFKIMSSKLKELDKNDVPLTTTCSELIQDFCKLYDASIFFEQKVPPDHNQHIIADNQRKRELFQRTVDVGQELVERFILKVYPLLANPPPEFKVTTLPLTPPIKLLADTWRTHLMKAAMATIM